MKIVASDLQQPIDLAHILQLSSYQNESVTVVTTSYNDVTPSHLDQAIALIEHMVREGRLCVYTCDACWSNTVTADGQCFPDEYLMLRC